MTTRYRNRIRKFNPGAFQADSELIEQFVVRQFEFETILGIIRDNSESDSCQHTMVVAPRGRGKTMLLARTAAELRSNDDLSRLLLPVRFMEESLEIFTMADFWLDALFHLASECARRNPELGRELLERHAHLCKRWQSQDLELYARAAVLDAAERLGCRLVLMVENFQALLKDANKDFGWKLRQILQTEPRIILIGSATSQFAGLTDAEAPLFDFFRILELKPLSTGECQRLWTNVTGESVKAEAMRPLEILTGGSPRLLVIVAGFEHHRSFRRLMEDLVLLVDEHTEYFRGHLEALGKTERRVYLAVVDLWQSSTAGEIRDRARMDIRTVSTMLGRLVDRGAVTRTGHGRKRLYAAAEGLYCIYYKLRREHDEVGVVEYLIRFMAAFYGNAERQAVISSLIQEASDSETLRKAINRVIRDIPELKIAIAKTETAGENIDDLIKQGTAAYSQGDLESAAAALEKQVDRLRNAEGDALQRLMALVMTALSAIKFMINERESADSLSNEVIERFGRSSEPDEQWAVAFALLTRGHVLQFSDDVNSAMKVWEEVIRRFGNSSHAELNWPVSLAMTNQARVLYERDDLNGAVILCDELNRRFWNTQQPELQVVLVEGLLLKGQALEQLGTLDPAMNTFVDIVTRFDHSGHPRLHEAVFEAHIAIAKLENSLGLTEKAHKSCIYLRKRLTAENGGPVSARALSNGTRLFIDLAEPDHALDTFRCFYDLVNPDDESCMREIVNLVMALLVVGVSANELVEILSGGAGSAALGPLIVALRMEAGEVVRAPREVLAVAEDICQEIDRRRATNGRTRGCTRNESHTQSPSTLADA